jgi:hypothetical protein
MNCYVTELLRALHATYTAYTTIWMIKTKNTTSTSYVARNMDMRSAYTVFDKPE